MKSTRFHLTRIKNVHLRRLAAIAAMTLILLVAAVSSIVLAIRDFFIVNLEWSVDSLDRFLNYVNPLWPGFMKVWRDQ